METTDPEVTGRRLGGSFTIPEWCEHRRVSISMYYKLKAQGKAPAYADCGVEGWSIPIPINFTCCEVFAHLRAVL
jgi:hypothetical protein